MNTLMTDVAGLSLDVAGMPGVPASAPGAGAAFAAQLGQALGRLGEGQTLAGVPGLQATALSPGLQVLTPVNGVSDQQALADFAKAQGIDESAVQWLFQLPAGAAGAAGDAPVQDAHPPDGLVASGDALAAALPGAGLIAGAGAEDGVGVGKGGTTVPFGAVESPVNGSVLSPAPAASAQGHAMTAAVWLQGGAAAVQATTATAELVSTGVLSTEAVSAPNASLASTEAPSGESAQPVSADEETSATALAALALWTTERWGSDAQRTARAEAPPTPADPAYGLTQVNKAMSPEITVMIQKMVAAQDAGHRKAVTHVDVLELDPELQADLRNWLDDGMVDPMPAEARPSAQAQASATAALSPQAAMAKTDAAAQAMAPASNAAERAENLQALAQRVGQAVGQRLVSMIERGHWNVKFMLKPQQLGEIEVDLRMRSGELDAAFRATNAFTRDLLQDGLPRLREVMSSMGMDVASMHVGNGQAQRHGGNPTPAFKTPKGGQAVSDAGSNAAPTQAPVRMARQGGNGWDVMV